MLLRPVVTLLVAVLALTGCSSTQDRATPQTPVTTASDPLARCTTGIPTGTPARAVQLNGPHGISLSAADFGPVRGSDSVLVLLHQTGPWGLCGWGRFAARAAAAGVASVAIDMCGYGESTCDPDVSAAAQVELAVNHAREDLSADRVVLVGASMGGSSTVLAVADGARVDAWVDVSGVSSWNGVRLLDRADALADAGHRGLIVYARTDGPDQYAAARHLARASGARFLDGGAGHGYELMTDFRGRLLPGGRAVLRFARGAED